MIYFYPTDNIVYKSKLTCNEIKNKLLENTQYKVLGRINKDNTFRIQRIIYYQNSFLPQIKGIISDHQEGATIEVNMSPNIIVIFFMSFWFIFSLAGSIYSFYIMITSEFNVFLLIPLWMIIFGFIMYYASFKTESIKSKKDLLHIFEAEELPNKTN